MNCEMWTQVVQYTAGLRPLYIPRIALEKIRTSCRLKRPSCSCLSVIWRFLHTIDWIVVDSTFIDSLRVNRRPGINPMATDI